ncbi:MULTISPECIES: hypothetical protein [unclassified Mesorhizobium]|uniref:hypothetical protein n=1 Tax=unclassified Mesorhizobium TaxID=325217 RepID=UPI003338B282
MATVATLEADGVLVRIEVEMNAGTMPWRRLYGTPDFVKWLQNVLPMLTTAIVGHEIEPSEQVDARFNEFISGENMLDDRRFKKLSWTPDHFVWEFKTLDIRIFGWMVEKDCLICTFGDTKDEIERLRKYGKYIAQTVYARNNLGLDEPNFVNSKEYCDVLSDAD